MPRRQSAAPSRRAAVREIDNVLRHYFESGMDIFQDFGGTGSIEEARRAWDAHRDSILAGLRGSGATPWGLLYFERGLRGGELEVALAPMRRVEEERHEQIRLEQARILANGLRKESQET
ncbi:hypothetical protein HQ520_10805 [bacterium]|nr:hypothetical protein [bacterium]